MDEELDKMMADAMSEIEELDNDTDQNEDQQEESTDSSTDEAENSDSEQDNAEDERDDDQEDNDLDEEQQEDEDNTQENDEEIDEDNQEESFVEFEPIEVEIAGQKISINNKEEMLAFVKRGANSMNSPRQRKSHNDQIIEQGKLSNDDLTLLIDAKNGNKAAIAKLAKDSGVDLYDIEDGSTYEPTFNPQYMSEADEVAEDIMQDGTLIDDFRATIKNVPAEFTVAISQDPKALRLFADQVKSGMAQKVIPEAIKAQMLNGGEFIEHYGRIGRELTNAKEKPTPGSKTKRVTNPRAEKLKKMASNKKGSNKGTRNVANGEDIWGMSDKDFAKEFGM